MGGKPFLVFFAKAIELNQYFPFVRRVGGKVFAVDDPIWDIIYPPNHWGCRSIVRKVSGKKADNSSTLDTDSVKGEWRNNLARDGNPFPSKSYSGDNENDTIENKLGNTTYEYVERPNRNGTVFRSRMHIKMPITEVENIEEAERRKFAADVMADALNKTFFILPEINYKNVRYPFYFKHSLGKSSPDLFDGEFWDVGRYGSAVFDKAGKQANNIIILLGKDDNINVAKSVIKAKLNGTSNFAKHAKNVFLIAPDKTWEKIR